MATINFNAFAQETAAGKLEQSPNMATYSVRLEVGSDTTLKPCTAVKLKNTTSKLITVTPTSSDADEIFGFIPLNHKNNGLVVTSTEPVTVEVASFGCIMTMEASAAINRGAHVTYSYSTNKIATAASSDLICGLALDAAGASGDLVRVLLTVPNVPVAES